MMQISPGVLEDVRRLVAEVLEVEFEDVQPNALFFDRELAGDSLGVLELSFRIERHFGVRVRFNDLTGDDLQVNEQGVLTPESLARLKSKYPFLKLDDFTSRPLLQRTDLLTIEAIAGFVQMALDSREAAAASTISGPR